MIHDRKYPAIVLKKQPFGEADEIVTFYTRDAGKIRGLAKSAKSPKSRLQFGLQSLFLVEITLAGRGLAKIIGTEVRNAFPHIRERLQAAGMGMYAAELVLKFTPDEQKNEQLFDSMAAFLTLLDSEPEYSPVLSWALAAFKLELLEALGLSVQHPEGGASWFSSSRGGFLPAQQGQDAQPVSSEAYRDFLILSECGLAGLMQEKTRAVLSSRSGEELQRLLSAFLSYHLERDIRSEGFLNL